MNRGGPRARPRYPGVRLVPPCYVPEGDSPLSLLATVLSTSASEHRAGVRATVPVVQVRGECSFGARRGSLLAQLEEEEEEVFLTSNRD